MSEQERKEKLKKLIDFLKKRQDIPYISFIVSKGLLNILIIYHKIGCNWHESLCSKAAESGHLNCLKYLHENGCPWSTDTCAFAAKKRSS